MRVINALKWLLGDVTRALVTALVLLALALGAWAWLATRARDRAEVRVADLLAQRDTTRLIHVRDLERTYARLARLAGDVTSLRDSLKKAGAAQAVTTIVVRPETVHVVSADTVARPRSSGLDTVTLARELSGPPATVTAQVHVSRDSVTWRGAWDLAVTPSPLLIKVDVGCKAHLTPDVLVTLPTWAQLDSLEAHTVPGLCRDPPSFSVRGPGGFARAALLVGVAFGAGWLLGH